VLDFIDGYVRAWNSTYGFKFHHSSCFISDGTQMVLISLTTLNEVVMKTRLVLAVEFIKLLQ